MTNRLTINQKESKASPLPEQLVKLPEGQWAVWHWPGLRGAGFPAEQVLALAIPECAASADQLLRAQNELARVQDTARDALLQTLREIAADTERRKVIKKALRRVNKSKLPQPLEFDCVARDVVDTFRQAWIEVDTARSNFEQAFADAIDHVSQVIYQVVCTDRFREAVTWQNKRALLTAINPILRKPPGTTSHGSKCRQHEELVANYLQRYCVKNDTIGFFGPVGWAKLVSQDERLRQLNLRALDVFEKAKSGVDRAAGDAENLDKALSVMNTVFTRLTGASPTRAAGKTYAARTLVYEDCRRDIEVGIGQEILRSLGPPLSLLLESARWFTVEAADIIYRNIVQKVYAELATQVRSPVAPLVDMWPKFQHMLYTKDLHPLAPLLSAFQDRWSQILSLPAEAHRVAYTSKELRPRVLAVFESSQPGWPFTRYQTPDVLIAASSTQAIRRGDYQFVMGEIHIGINTLTAAFSLTQHPVQEELFQALETTQPKPRVVLVPPKEWPELAARIYPALVLSRDFRLVSTPDAYGSPEWQLLPIGTLVIEELNGELMVRTRDGQLYSDVIEFIADLVSNRVINFFRILRPAPHTPRITVDRLVVSREAWRFPVGELDFAYERDEATRFLAFRRWGQDYGIPRFVFVKTPIERKPFYVDFASPIFVNIFAKHIRRTKEQGSLDALVTVTEMLPDPFHIWLPDAKGRRYTSELRIVAVDLG